MLKATDLGEGRNVSFEASEFEPGQGLFGLEEIFGTKAESRVTERREGMKIKRSAIYVGEASALQVSPRGKLPTRAKVALTRPFEGAATLIQQRGEPVGWEGPLLVRMPGIGGVPLAGPGVSARLCRIDLLSADAIESPCYEGQSGRESLLRHSLLQLSGSHSQALADVRLSISR